MKISSQKIYQEKELQALATKTDEYINGKLSREKYKDAVVRYSQKHQKRSVLQRLTDFFGQAFE